MNFIKRYKYVILSLASLGLMANTCRMEITDIQMPDDINAGQEIEITVTGEYEPGALGNTQVVFAILAPTSMNLKENATLTFSCEGEYIISADENYKDIPMVPMEQDAVEVSTGMPWKNAYLSRVGVMGNVGGSVEWTVFRTEAYLDINDKADDSAGDNKFITGTVKIKLNTGSENAKFYMGFSFCGTQKGLTEQYSDTEEYGYIHNEQTRLVEITGGDGPVVDYTTVKLISTTPSVFRYGDIFAVNFEAGDTFAGEDAVYLCGKAVLADGSEKVMEDKVDKALMEAVTGTSYRRYIYPRDFFGLPADADISEIYVWFSNADGSVISKEGEDGTLLNQTAE